MASRRLVKAPLQRRCVRVLMRRMTAALLCAEPAEQCMVKDARKLKPKGNAEHQEEREVS